jgi:hypothetical protein
MFGEKGISVVILDRFGVEEVKRGKIGVWRE